MKSGSVSDIDLVDPVGTLAEAINGLRDTVVARAVHDGQKVNVRELDADFITEPAPVLNDAAQAVREIEASVVKIHGKVQGDVAVKTGPVKTTAKHSRAMADHLMHSRELVDGVLALDHDFYQDRHQQSTGAESDDPAAILVRDLPLVPPLCTPCVAILIA